MSGLFSRISVNHKPVLPAIGRSICLMLLLMAPSFASAQEHFVMRQDAGVSVELSTAIVGDLMRETTAALASLPVADADGGSPAVESGFQSWTVVALSDVAWVLVAGLIGFILLSNRQSR